jgi:hypothetical protein
MRTVYKVKNQKEFELLKSLTLAAGCGFCGLYESSGIVSYPYATISDGENVVAGIAYAASHSVVKTLGEFIQVVIDTINTKQPVRMQISDDYEAVYKPGDSGIQVGCQTISVKTLEELLSRIKQVNE